MSAGGAAASRQSGEVTTERTRGWFFVGVAAVMLAINFIGFAPSYFLKPLFDTPELPLWTHIHGVLFTSWFVLFLGQSILVQRREVRLHRRLGKAGALLAALMVLSGSAILHARALEYDGSEESLASTALVVSGNVTLLFLFALFVGLGVLFRSRPDWHRRLMLLASLAMMPQALGRLGRLPIPRIVGAVPNEVLFGMGGMVLLMAAVWTHDVLRRGRPHMVTGLGCPLILVMVMVAAVVLPGTWLGEGLVVWLNGAAP